MLIQKPYKIAIVDDDPTIVMTLERILKNRPNIESHTFTNPNVALSAIRALDIRVVIADLNMPQMNGDVLLDKCLQLKQGVQFIIISGENSLLMANSCLRAGAKDILTKPIVPRDVELILKETIFFLEKWNGIILDRARYHPTAEFSFEKDTTNEQPAGRMP